MKCFLKRFLYTEELDEVAKKNDLTKKFFLGTYAADVKPENVKDTCCCIWNTDKAADDGQHWVAFFKHQNKVKYFDSYAKPLRFYKRTFWKNYIEKELKCKFEKDTDLQNQSSISTTCGAWSLLYLYDECYNFNKDFNEKKLFIPFFLASKTFRKKTLIREAMLIRNEEYLRRTIFKVYKSLRKVYRRKCCKKNKTSQKCCSLKDFNRKKK